MLFLVLSEKNTKVNDGTVIEGRRNYPKSPILVHVLVKCEN